MVVSTVKVNLDFEKPIVVDYMFNVVNNDRYIRLTDIVLNDNNIFFSIINCSVNGIKREDLMNDEILIDFVYKDIVFKLENMFKIYGEKILKSDLGIAFGEFEIEYE